MQCQCARCTPEHRFITGLGLVPVKTRLLLEILAHVRGAKFENPNLPHTGHIYYFTRPSQGADSDRRTEIALRAAMAAHGIVLPTKQPNYR